MTVITDKDTRKAVLLLTAALRNRLQTLLNLRALLNDDAPHDPEIINRMLEEVETMSGTLTRLERMARG